MKRNLFFWLSLAVIIGSLVVYAIAQQVAPGGERSKLQSAIELLNAGKPEQAKELIAAIGTNDTEHATAQCYKALCLYDLKDTLGFLNAMESPAIKEAVIAPQIREDLAGKQIDALFQYRKFEALLAKAETFQKEHPASVRLNAVAELQLAALFERGMKKTYEASTISDTNRFNARWAEAKANLEEFLSLASSLRVTNYNTLQKRVLNEDIWVARITLGDEKAALEEIPNQDAAGREKLSLLKVQLFQKLQPNELDKNLQMMTAYVKEFPESKSRKRVEFDMASLSFAKGEQLCKQAGAAEKMGDMTQAAEKRNLATTHFEFFRSLQSQAVVDKTLGIEESDILDLRGDLLYSYFLEKNYVRLSSLTTSMISRSTPGDLHWTMGKVYGGIVLQSQTPARVSEAAACLDEVLALNFNSKPDHDYYVLLAVKWRVQIALISGDVPKARELVQWVQDGVCRKDLKTAFLKEYGGFMTLPNKQSK